MGELEPLGLPDLITETGDNPLPPPGDSAGLRLRQVDGGVVTIGQLPTSDHPVGCRFEMPTRAWFRLPVRSIAVVRG